MDSRTRRVSSFVVFTAVLLAVSFIAVACGDNGTKGGQEPKLIVGALHVGSIQDAGYNQAQHDGLVYLEDNVPGIKLIEASNVSEGPDSQRVMENMVRQGAKLIFPQSFGYLDWALKTAKANPTVTFMHPAGYKMANNLGTYWSASDQLHYALGVGAGLMTKTDKIAFIGAMPIPQIIESIDAFHLGARSVNPNITTYALFTGTWLDPAKEAAATNTVVDRGADVVASLVDSPISVVQTAEQRGIYSIGYHSAAGANFAPKGWISGVDFNWGPLFVKYAHQVMNGTWKATMDRPGLSADIVRLAPFGKNVPQDVRDAMTETVQKFISGELKSPLQGPVYDQSGKLRIKAGQVPGADLINTIDWFAQGIVGQTQ
jgi:basic membrane protein A and related proteins